MSGVRSKRQPTDGELIGTEAIERVVFNAQTETLETPDGLEFRFRKKSECWPWKVGVRGHKQYPTVNVRGRQILAHRFVYAYARIGTDQEQWPEHVHHRCENTLCLNPRHLVGLTAAEHGREHGKIRRKSKAPTNTARSATSLARRYRTGARGAADVIHLVPVMLALLFLAYAMAGPGREADARPALTPAPTTTRLEVLPDGGLCVPLGGGIEVPAHPAHGEVSR